MYLRLSGQLSLFFFRLKTELQLLIRLLQVYLAFRSKTWVFFPILPVVLLMMGLALPGVYLGARELLEEPRPPKLSIPSSVKPLAPPNPVKTKTPASEKQTSLALATPIENKPQPSLQEQLPLPPHLSYLVASKSQKTLFLLRRSGNSFELIKKFDLVYGGVEGNKVTEGDRRTPEGNYWVTGILPGPPTGDLYGSLILPLSYPNAQDRSEGKTGSGIWIHGSAWGEETKPTRGCLKLNNTEIVHLAKIITLPAAVTVTPGPINIEEYAASLPAWMSEEYTFHRLNYDEVQKDQQSWSRERVLSLAHKFLDERKAELQKDSEERAKETPESQACREFLVNWSQAWSSRAFEKYSGNYGDNFTSSSGQNREAFLDRKKRIFSSHDDLEVTLSQIRCNSDNNKTYTARFMQSYRAYRQGKQVNALRSGKEMVLALHSGNWSIIRE